MLDFTVSDKYNHCLARKEEFIGCRRLATMKMFL